MHAVVDVILQDLEAGAFERRLHGGDLRQDVYAVAVVVDHPLDPAHLTFDPVQPLLQPVLVVAARHACASFAFSAAGGATSRSRRLWKRRRRSEFETTKTLENAIAAAAITGLSSPTTASGMAATL